MSHGRLMSGLFPSSVTLRRSDVKWSTPWHASFPQQGQSWHSVISERHTFRPPALALYPASIRQMWENDSTKWRDKNNLAHLPPSHSVYLTLSSHPPTFLANLLPKKIKISCSLLHRLSSCFAYLLSCFLPFLPSFLHLFMAAAICVSSRRRQRQDRATWRWTRRNLA